jgi:hypothetical protein
MGRLQKLLATALVVAGCASLVTLGVFGLFSATTQNAGNEISTGTVALADNDAGSAMFNVTGAKPGDSWQRCIRVTYNGTLPAQVHFYTQANPGALASYMNMKIHTGTQASPVFPSCTGFNADPGSDLYDGVAASSFVGSFDNGLPIASANGLTWQPGDSVIIRFWLTLDPATPDATQGSSTGPVTVVWEARNA